MKTPSPAELAALSTALTWSVTGLILRTQSAKMDPAAMTLIRCGVASVFFWLLLPFDQPLSQLAVLSAEEWLLFVVALCCTLVAGDTIYLAAIREMGISRAIALASTFPLTTLLFEYLILDQAVGPRLLSGCALVVIGAAALSIQTSGPGQAPARLKYGVFLSLVAALLWGLGTVLLKPAIAHMTPIQANALRLPLVALFLFVLRRCTGQRTALRSLERRATLIVALTGLLGMGFGALMFLLALKEIGPAKTVTLTSVAPVFGVVLAAVFLKEKITLGLLLGVTCCMAGVYLVI